MLQNKMKEKKRSICPEVRSARQGGTAKTDQQPCEQKMWQHGLMAEVGDGNYENKNSQDQD
jgi:hypothetical protein